MISAQEIFITPPASILKKMDVLLEGNWHQWEPEVLLGTIGDNLPPQAADKVLAVQAVASNTELAFKSAAAFENIVHAFCNNGIEPEALQPVFIEEIMYAAPQILEIAKYLHGDAVPTDFSPEISQYVASVAKYRDWDVLPDRLSFAQEALDRLTGMHEGSEKHTEFKHALDVVAKMYSAIHASGVSDYESVLPMLEEDSQHTQIMKKALGAYLYDPTIVYGDKGNKA